MIIWGDSKRTSLFFFARGGGVGDFWWKIRTFKDIFFQPKILTFYMECFIVKTFLLSFLSKSAVLFYSKSYVNGTHTGRYLTLVFVVKFRSIIMRPASADEDKLFFWKTELLFSNFQKKICAKKAFSKVWFFGIE